MNSSMLCRIVVLLLCGIGATVSAHAHEAEMYCAHTLTFAAAAAPDSPEYRKYAPDREADILHVLSYRGYICIIPNCEQAPMDTFLPCWDGGA
jgi:hypothetical protein